MGSRCGRSRYGPLNRTPGPAGLVLSVAGDGLGSVRPTGPTDRIGGPTVDTPEHPPDLEELAQLGTIVEERLRGLAVLLQYAPGSPELDRAAGDVLELERYAYRLAAGLSSLWAHHAEWAGRRREELAGLVDDVAQELELEGLK